MEKPNIVLLEVTMDSLRLAWCNSNERVHLSFRWCGSRSLDYWLWLLC